MGRNIENRRAEVRGDLGRLSANELSTNNLTEVRCRRVARHIGVRGALVLCAMLVAGVVSPVSRGEAQSVRTVSLVGDSLVAGRGETYAKAFLVRGVPVTVDGVGSRAIRYGWQCKVQSGLRVFPQMQNKSCRREGLELLRWWAQTGKLGSEVVLALGTNDAALYPGVRSLPNLQEVRRILGERRVWIVTVRKLNGSSKPAAWNKVAAAWCAKDVACSIIPWAESPISGRSSIYSSDMVHLTQRGAELRAEFIATVVAGH